MKTPPLPSEINLVLGGEAGQGLQTIGLILARTFLSGGLHVLVVNEFMSRIRGGSNSVTLRVGTSPVRAFTDRVDLCVVFDHEALDRLRGRCAGKALLIGDPKISGDTAGITALPLHELSTRIGGSLYVSSIVCGFLVRLLGWKILPLETALRRIFSEKDSLEKNLAAALLGWNSGAELNGRFPLPIRETNQDRLLFDGSQSIALGALAGGCNFIASYPMSPATGVLIHLAKQAYDHGVVVEQAEDEISAINMGLGAWYAGARALVSTSGGGFDLMAEGLSLCGAIESPLVIHLAQRPGPGTGLPTRTEQGDLEIARYSGHGEFPRAILAPSTPEEAFACAAHAFTMADASQSPVIILTDQYLLDTLCDLDPFILPDTVPASRVIPTSPGYQRYARGPDGVSPRGIPGLGKGRVCVDSDEHDAKGQITEDFGTRISMVDKRLAKMRLLREDFALPPHLHGSGDYHRLIIGWGSTSPAIIEALALVRPEQTAYLHCVQLYPLSAALITYMSRATRIIVIENNATGQFARLLRAETSWLISAEWHKYNGLPFSVEELVALLQKEINDER